MAADNVKQLFVNPVGLTMTLQEFNMAAPIATTASKYICIYIYIYIYISTNNNKILTNSNQGFSKYK